MNAHRHCHGAWCPLETARRCVLGAAFVLVLVYLLGPRLRGEVAASPRGGRQVGGVSPELQEPTLRIQNGHARSIGALAIDPDSQIFVTADQTALKVWEMATGALLQTYEIVANREPIL